MAASLMNSAGWTRLTASTIFEEYHLYTKRLRNALMSTPKPFHYVYTLKNA